jgi:hypothetical protein
MVQLRAVRCGAHVCGGGARGSAAGFFARSRTAGAVTPKRTPLLPLTCSAKALPANFLLPSVFKRQTKKCGVCKKNSSVRAPPLHQASVNRPRQHHTTRPRAYCAKATKASHALNAATHCARHSSSQPPSQVLPRTSPLPRSPTHARATCRLNTAPCVQTPTQCTVFWMIATQTIKNGQAPTVFDRIAAGDAAAVAAWARVTPLEEQVCAGKRVASHAYSNVYTYRWR